MRTHCVPQEQSSVLCSPSITAGSSPQLLPLGPLGQNFLALLPAPFTIPRCHQSVYLNMLESPTAQQSWQSVVAKKIESVGDGGSASGTGR